MENLDLEVDTEKELVNNFIQEYVDLLLEKKAFDKKIKALRYKYEERGVNTTLSIRAMNNVRAERKAGKEALEKLENCKNILLSDSKTQSKIDLLDNKE